MSHRISRSRSTLDHEVDDVDSWRSEQSSRTIFGVAMGSNQMSPTSMAIRARDKAHVLTGNDVLLLRGGDHGAGLGS